MCSEGELAVALRAGFPAGRIAFHGSNKSERELRTAVGPSKIGRQTLSAVWEPISTAVMFALSPLLAMSMTVVWFTN